MERGLKRKDTKSNSSEHHQLKKSRTCNDSQYQLTEGDVNSANGHVVHWNSLPINVMIVIFGKLAAGDLAQCSLVCNYWQEILQDDYVWKQLFSLHWNVAPTTPLRPDVQESSWLSEYKRLHILQNGSATVTCNVHHGESVYDLTFSRSGKYLCTSSKRFIVMWSVGDTIEVFNKLYISCNEKADQGIQRDTESGIRYTLFSETDEYLMIFGLQLQLDGEEYSDKMFQVLIYTFPDCFLAKTVDWWDNNCDASPGWLGRSTFIITELNESGYAGKLMVWSVFKQHKPKEIVNVDYDIEDVAVMNSRNGLQKLLSFCYDEDERLDEDDDDDFVDYTENRHKMSFYVVNSDLPLKEHVCNPKRFCCVESKYYSPNPNHYSCDRHPVMDKHFGAAIRQVDDSLTDNFAVVCRPIRENCEGGKIKYSKEKLDLRIFDLKMNLMRVVPLQSMVPPQLYLFDHDYWLDEHFNSLMISGDLHPGLLHYYDLHYNVHIKKKTGHTEGLNYAAFAPNTPFLLCTVSDDYLIKFWDFRSK